MQYLSMMMKKTSSIGWRHVSVLSMSCRFHKLIAPPITYVGFRLAKEIPNISQRLKSTRPALIHDDDDDDDDNNHSKNYQSNPPLTVVNIPTMHSTTTSLPFEITTRTRLPTSISHLSLEDHEILKTTKKKEVIPESHRKQPISMTYSDDTIMRLTSSLHIVKPQEPVPRYPWPVFRMMDEDGCFRDPNLDDGPSSSQEQSLRLTSTESTDHNMRSLAFFRSHLKNLYPHYAIEFDKSPLFQLARDVQPTSFTPSLDDDKYNKEETKDKQGQDINELPLFLRAHRHMIRLREMDQILLNAQRQGRISFYMTCTGEEAIHMGSASALQLQDHVLVQYREQGVLMWRGFTLEQFTNQCFTNDKDLGKGRQMPVHYGSRALNYHTVSSPLGTQIPQAVGVAYRLQLSKKNDNVTICYFGDGCTSTPDFHSGLNFAATLNVPVIFLCRNNGYAISTPSHEQYSGDGVVARGPAYGMAAIRVDGNDVFAIHAAVRAAREYALTNNAPVLIEAMTYRVGHHSTSDDSSKYRDSDEVQRMISNHDPLIRLENFLMHHGWLTQEEAKQIKDHERQAILNAMGNAEKRPKPSLECLFTDVYHDMPPHIIEQKDQLMQHVSKYPDRYS